MPPLETSPDESEALGRRIAEALSGEGDRGDAIYHALEVLRVHVQRLLERYSANRPRGYRARPATQHEPRWDLVTDVVAVDVWAAMRERDRFIGRVSVVDYDGRVIYDVYADHGGFGTPAQFLDPLPPSRFDRGLRGGDLDPANGARPIAEVQRNLKRLMEGRIVVIHGAPSARRAIGAGTTDWGRVDVRDTQTFSEYGRFGTAPPGPSRQTLARGVLGRPIPAEGYSGVRDAQATMRLYRKRERGIEREYVELVQCLEEGERDRSGSRDSL